MENVQTKADTTTMNGLETVCGITNWESCRSSSNDKCDQVELIHPGNNEEVYREHETGAS